jgi:excisionase family DNA binding protein
MSSKKILTAGEMAKYLRIHPYTVKRLAREGKIPGFKIGAQWRFDAQEIDMWRKA